jgi:uncharacterized membrane protein YbhN (UPF0104 family)
MWMYRLKGRFIALALGLSLVGHLGFVLGFYFSAQVFRMEGNDVIPTMAEHFLIVPIGMTWQAVFPTPGGMGGAEYVYGLLYKMVIDTPETQARGVLGSLVYRCVSLMLALLGFVVYLVTKPSAQANAEPPPEKVEESRNGFLDGEAKAGEEKSSHQV